MIFKPMKKEDVLKALEGHEDILKKAAKENQDFFSRLSCPSCGGDVLPVVSVIKGSPFREGALLPNYIAKCKICNVEFEPVTGIQITMPR